LALISEPLHNFGKVCGLESTQRILTLRIFIERVSLADSDGDHHHDTMAITAALTLNITNANHRQQDTELKQLRQESTASSLLLHMIPSDT
jgi:hypothetical protein